MNKSRKLGFGLFWLAHAISTAGDAFGFVAMPLFVLEITGSLMQMGVVTAFSCVGQIGAGLFSGVIVDRVDRRSLMIGCDIGRMLLYLSLPVLQHAAAANILTVYAVALFAGALGNTFTVAQLAAIPNIAENRNVARANARLQATHALTYVFGAMLAGAVAAQFGPSAALGVDGLSFALSALCLAAVGFRYQAGSAGPIRQGGAFDDFLNGIRFLLDHEILRSLAAFQVLVASFASVGLSAAVIDVIVFRLRSDLRQGGQTVGIALGVASLGAVLGALLSPRIRGRLGFAACALGGTGIQALGLALAGLVTHVLAVVAGAGLWCMGLTIRGVACNSLRQTVTPDPLLGRVSAAGWTPVYAAGALGAVFVTQLGARLGTGQALVITGAALALISTGALRSPLGRPLPAPATH